MAAIHFDTEILKPPEMFTKYGACCLEISLAFWKLLPV
jgi:hypothetical protein